MRIAVMAAGALGGYFGARMAAAGHDVVFIARGANLEAIRKNGLKVESVHGDLQRLVSERAEASRPIPADIVREAKIAAAGVHPTSAAAVAAAEVQPVFSCPDCGGPLSIVDDRVIRMRCDVGHANTAESLLDAQAVLVEKALWIAHRTNRERAAVLRRMAAEARERDQLKAAEMWDNKAAEFEEHAKVLHRLVMSGDYVRPRIEVPVA